MTKSQLISCKAIILIGLFISIHFLVSCNKDSDEPEKEIPTDFVDQPLQGKIGDTNWTPQTGFQWVDENYDNTLTIQMSSTFFSDPCTTWSADGKAISFRVGNTVDLYDITTDFLGDHEFSIMDSSRDFWENVPAKVELLTITSEEITGRLYTKYNDTNYLSGNFTITFMCDY